MHVPQRRNTRRPRRFPLGAILIPLFLGLILVAVTKRWEIALFALFSPVMIGWNYVEERRAHRDELDEHGRTYEQEVAAATTTVTQATADWTSWQLQAHPAPYEVHGIGTSGSHRLWERQPHDPDFLDIRLGLATRQAPITLHDDRPAGADPDPDEPDLTGILRVSDVPAVAQLTRSGALGVVANDHVLDRTLANLVAQLCVLHSPVDVTLAAAVAAPDLADSMRWLPHTSSEDLPGATVVTTPREAAQLLRDVADLGAVRREAVGTRTRADIDALLPIVVVVLDNRLQLDPALVNSVLSCRDLGIATVWLGSDRRQVPTAVPELLTLTSDDTADLIGHRGGTTLALRPEQTSLTGFVDLCTSLAPLRDATDVRRSQQVPDQVSLEDLIGDLATPSAMRTRWDTAPTDRLTAHLGIAADGPVDLELGPQGAHTLVGGTTGSGKSELLQSLVGSLAAQYPPDRVGFLLVDYKGGAAFKDAMHLPHCVGVVTDLDEHLTRRVLRALDAEIRRREELLSQGNSRDLTELRHARPDLAPEDLLIVVDEFATLAKEIPEFVEGVVDIAARGRSLGLRLVLATQRPAGVINDRIRANVGVRIALRVNDEADSLDVIGDRAAAHIPRNLPGRAYLQGSPRSRGVPERVRGRSGPRHRTIHDRGRRRQVQRRAQDRHHRCDWRQRPAGPGHDRHPGCAAQQAAQTAHPLATSAPWRRDTTKTSSLVSGSDPSLMQRFSALPTSPHSRHNKSSRSTWAGTKAC